MAAAKTRIGEQVRVGVGVFVFNDAGSFVVGKRMGSHGAGTWALPGGHIEFGESFETCATREIFEETGLHIKADSVRFLTATNDVMTSEHKHYVTIFMGCRPEVGGLEPRVMEPEKCERWEWVTWREIRRWAETQMHQKDDEAQSDERGSKSSAQLENRPLFLPLLSLLRQRSGIDPAEAYEPKSQRAICDEIGLS